MLLSRWLLAACIFLSMLCLQAGAEPATPPGDEIKATRLDYKERPGGDGRLASAEVTLTHTPQRLFVRGTDVSAPFSLQVIAASAQRPLDVTVHRQNWGNSVQSGSTGSEGAYVFEGRAYGDVGVQLTSPDGSPARATVVFWQGTPASPTMAAVYTNRDIQKADGVAANFGPGNGTSLIMYVIAGLLAVIVVILGIMLLRRGKGANAALLLIGGLALTAPEFQPRALAQGDAAPNPFEVGDGPKPAPAPETPRDPKPGSAPNPFAVDGPVPEIPRDKDKEATAGKPDDKENPFTGETTLRSGDPIELKPEDFDPSNAPKDDAPVDKDYGDRLAAAEQRIQDLHREASANRAEIERLRMLVDSDRKNEPDPSNLPPMPLTCRPPAVERSSDVAMMEAWENYDACGACYSEPLEKLDELMVLYERLRILYSSTADFVSEQLLIGDQVPKPHYLLDSAWQKQKASILESLNGTRKAYDDKWEEFNGRLVVILDELGTCETRHNNNPMWRETDGQLFYNTIKASYQRTN